MVTTRSASTPNGKVNGRANGHANGNLNGHSVKAYKPAVETTDRSRWRMLDEDGRHTWHYLETDEQVEKWPQSIADKYFLGLDTGLPPLSRPTKPSEAVNNVLEFYSKQQLPAGHWGCEYGGPQFLISGFVFAWYATNTPIPEPYRIELKNYIFATQQKDGGWGLHIEGVSSVFGTGMYYVALRILGADPEDPRLIKARGKLHSMGGALSGPHWLKWWFSILGISQWELPNPVPPELWLLPDWTPISPWRWWIHIRQIMLPMSYLWSKQWVAPETELIRQLRQEVYTTPYESINWDSHRNDISQFDDYHPKTWLLKLIYLLIVWIWIPFLRTASIAKRAEAWTWRLIQYEDANTDYACLAPINASMNTLACYVEEGPDSYSFKRHLDRLHDYCWMSHRGMHVNGTNGVQNWDTSFTIGAVVECGLAKSPKWRPMLEKALAYFERQQLLDEVPDREICYRAERKGAWTFSNKDQGYTVSDCTAEGLRAVLLLQNETGYKAVVPEERIKWAADLLLTMQNKHSGGCSSYEIQRGSEYLEMLNAAEVFGRIMVEYDYVECTTAVVTALSLFQKHYPDYRAADIQHVKARAVKYVKSAQRPDGSWYGSWGVCFTYAAMFSLESLAHIGETYANSEYSRKACKFLIDHQMADGGWGESYLSSDEKRWVDHPEKSQVVQTAWAVIALMYAEYPDKGPIKRALQMVMGRQQANGEWLQEAIEGVFNCSCMISYPNYKFIFPIKALGMYMKRYGDEVLQ
ncbi:Lanosterol synthase [Cyphellophora attinorum]|uniref:Terpene cyclase/mutase family member n=1 Tax=Cyphellophora attinorum TaxID=1664694 RepID=A0A0N1HLP4_9EURO|nr:Lanosterol synthase [Phialophora attinorum]KPI38000.1 Lanosterol synthase [Phialophora attinorum]